MRVVTTFILAAFLVFTAFVLLQLSHLIANENSNVKLIRTDSSVLRSVSRAISPSIKLSPRPPPALLEEQVKSYKKPIVISIVTGHYLGNFGYNTETDPRPPCMIQDVRVNCSLEGPQRRETADALWYHIPHMSLAGLQPRYHPNQLRVAMSMESAAYYPLMENPDLRKEVDILSTYKYTADNVNHYYDRNFDEDEKNFLTPPKVPTAQKKNVVAYMNRNCGAKNGRNDVVKELSKYITIDGYGCIGSSNRVDKVEVFSKAKFCIAMENSNVEWYVTEKIYQAFQAGCLPIYMGAPNFEKDFLPHPKAVILYKPESMNPKMLAEKLHQIANNDTLYEEHMAWRKMQLHELLPGFQRVVAFGRRPNPECRLCMKVAELRYLKEKNATLKSSN
ncbi:hypothetical protein CEUSTIGMA_g8719.t1 [Chlamydomonas eustigma]|uniref:Fucosyltransferase n=1 Tax=Chlamydomonas eustigma TaxID=1157962 RepID=A0A250XDX6_9CHLO|nr:hypothetical protein CEUSTIGMA_g8719.t1 [Chlamydomonas eustigma]|eukprot:GAX81287.1 hypothetical protein CEUSTIGMA_g8719.t1 [Chlamydomonas eustigma]